MPPEGGWYGERVSKFAIVIPTLEEQPALEDLLPHALAEADLVVVADGGSTDETVTTAAARGAIVVKSRPGRGRQLDRGARRAVTEGADALLFLHADTRLPAGFRASIESCLAAGAVGGGCLIEYPHARGLLRLAAPLVNWRTRQFKRPLGDQGQFATAASWQAVGGFGAHPILEDLDFIRRLARYGRLAIAELYLQPSARRFRQQGVVTTVLGNWLIFTLYRLGVSPRRLARLYRHVR